MSVLISALLVIAGIVVAAVGGLLEGSILGGVISGAGLIPACYAAWRGAQQEGQGQMVGAILMIFVSLIVGGLLIVLRFVDWIL